MDTHQALKTLRAVRQFEERPLPDEVVEQILQAGRWTGSAKNIQPWQFVVVRQRETLVKLAGCGHYASHLKGAALGVVIVTSASWNGAFDVGRCAQSMMLAAWNEGVGSCIASFHEEGCARQALGIPDDFRAQTSISFGYPQKDAPPMIEGQPRDAVLASVGRRPLAEMVHWEQW